MADTTKPADRSKEAAQVDDLKVRDASKSDRAQHQPAGATTPQSDRTVNQGHPLAGEPISRVQHADRAPPPETVTNARPGPLSSEDRERFEDLRTKAPNPNVLPPNVRTEEEEREYRRLSKIVADAERRAADEAARPDVRPDPKQRLDELKGKDRGEGEEIEHRRLEELMRDERRVEELKRNDKRTPDEDEELAMTRDRVRDARAAGGFDPNG